MGETAMKPEIDDSFSVCVHGRVESRYLLNIYFPSQLMCVRCVCLRGLSTNQRRANDENLFLCESVWGISAVNARMKIHTFNKSVCECGHHSPDPRPPFYYFYLFIFKHIFCHLISPHSLPRDPYRFPVVS